MNIEILEPSLPALENFVLKIAQKINAPAKMLPTYGRSEQSGRPHIEITVEDHIHVLLSLPSTISISKAVQLLKGNSSKWIHKTFPDHQAFEWQEGYGAFSIGVSGIETTVDYIKRQAEHHRRRSFKEELVEFLKKHNQSYDDSMLD